MVGYLHCGEQREGTRISEIQAKGACSLPAFGLEQMMEDFIQVVESQNKIIPVTAIDSL